LPIPAKCDCRKGFAFSSFLYRYRNLVERFLGALLAQQVFGSLLGKRKNARGSSTRYDRRRDTLPDAIKLFGTHLRITAHEPGA
jgi:hypothetical protein